MWLSTLPLYECVGAYVQPCRWCLCVEAGKQSWYEMIQVSNNKESLIVTYAVWAWQHLTFSMYAYWESEAPQAMKNKNK